MYTSGWPFQWKQRKMVVVGSEGRMVVVGSEGRMVVEGSEGRMVVVGRNKGRMMVVRASRCSGRAREGAR